MSRRELADAVNAFLFESMGEVASIDSNYVGKLERGLHRWPNVRYRTAFREILGVAKDADLGFFVDSRPSAGDHCLGAAPSDLADFAHAVAIESSLCSVETYGLVDGASIEHLLEEVRRLAVRFHELEPSRLLVEARMVRDLAHALAKRTGHVAQTGDLYLVAGAACGLLAVASFDLGLRAPADRQTHAASAYARLLGHAGLLSWSAGTRALIANWSGHPRTALEVIGEAVESESQAIGSARLHAIEARSWSLLGDAARVDAALMMADASLEQASGDDELYDHLGGEFGWGISVHSACAGTALLAVGDVPRAAERIRTALETMPTDPYAGLVAERARVDLAAAELVAGRLDGVVAALDEVWAVPPQKRRHGLVARMGHLRGDLVAGRWGHHQPATELSERIDVFCGEAVAAPQIV